MEKIGIAFRRTVASFAEDNRIPVVRFNKADRKIDRMRPYLARQAATGRAGVAAIGVTGVWFSYTLSRRRVSCYYFYLWDDNFGPAFVKVCAYFPYPMKIWVNGHEWAKRQAVQAGLGFTELSNGFASLPIRPRCRRDLRPAGPRCDPGVRRPLVVDSAAHRA